MEAKSSVAAPLQLDLPVDRPRTATRPTRAARQCHRLDPAVARALPDWAARHGCTVRDVVRAAVLAVLARHTGQSPVGVGVEPDAGGTGWWQLVVPVHDDPPFTELIRRMSAAPTPVGSPPSVMLGDLPPGDTSPHELCLQVRVEDDRVELHASRLVDLFDADTVDRLLGHVGTVLADVVAGNARPLSRLPLLTEAELRTMLVDWNDTATPLDHDSCLHDLFAARAARQPEVPALLHGDRVLTFGEVDRAANRLARHLRQLGVRRRVRVGICLERGPDLLVAILGVLKAGGAYVPLDADYPAERLRFVQSDSGYAVLVTTATLLPRLAAAGGEVVLLDEHAAAIAAQPADAPASDSSPDDLCYVIYTSGSTGQPKGIALRHRGVANNLLDLNTRFDVGPGDRVAALSSTSFDMSVYEFLGITIAGGAVVVPAADRLRDPAHWQELVRRHRITVWNSAPALLEMFLAHVLGQPDPGVDSLRLALLGGDWVDPTAPDRLRSVAPGVRVVVMGGATESSIHSTIYEAGSPLPGWTSIPYGRPMANQRTYILDDARQPVPVGVPGELHLAGIGLAEGYLGRPELTAERFFEWSYGPVTDRLYRTGDLARYRPDGLIELIGRVDFQVKIRGLRIELGEIEAALREQPDVAEAVVVARRDASGDNQLVGFVVPATTADGVAAPFDEAALRARLGHRLPAYMVPPKLVALDRLPLSPNGKVDRARLTTMVPARRARRARGQAPADSVERVVAELWCDLLEVDAVGTEDNFADLGGHSLAAMRLVGRLRDRLGVEVPVGEVLTATDLADFAARIRQMAAGRAAPAVVRTGRAERSPLSPAQRRLWYLSRLAPQSPVYHVSVAMSCPDDLDLDRLGECLTGLVARHEALRTRFVDDAGEPYQTVAEPWPVRVEETRVPADRLAEAVRAEAARPFDLTAGRLLRARVLRADTTATLVLTTHHIVVDGWSLDVLFGELEQAYAGVEPAPPTLRYTDFVAWQRDRLAERAYAAGLDYWRDKLAGAPALELPGDLVRPAEPTFSGGMLTFHWDQALRQALVALGRRHAATLFMTLLAGFSALLHRVSGQTDLVLGTPVAGRDRPELESVVGFFINIMPIRVDLTGEPTFAELLARVRAEALAGYRHQDVPFDLLVDELGARRGPAAMPLVQALFQLTNVPLRELRLGAARLRPQLLDTGTAKVDLAVTIEERPDGLTGLVEYNGDILRAETVRRLIDRYELLLRAAVADPGARISALSLLTEAERHQVLREWNDTAVPLPDIGLAELVADSVRRFGDAIAVEDAGTRLTYAELADRADRLAGHLRRHGVGPGQRVGICMERSADLVVGLLGIVRAGAAYVPLDPEYPARRLAWMVADAGVEVLLSHGRTAGLVPSAGRPEIVLDRDWATIAAQPPLTGPAGAGPADPAYVIYTSGSTGRPKGVLVPHRAVLRLVHRTDYVSLGPHSRVAQASNASFDAYTFELWGALGNGGCLVVVPKDVVIDPDALHRFVRQHRLTTMFLTTAAVNAVARHRPDAFAPLHDLLFGGEAVDPDAVRAILAAGPPTRLLHVYGPTEVTTFSTWYQVREVPPRAVTVPIGGPIANTECLVLDADLRPVPVGFPGELYLGGPGLADGYLNRPGLTADRFVPHPFADAPGQRLYRTGDLVRRRPDGAIEFVGRLDDQVKIRGFRVELGEIETALRRDDQIADAAVLVATDQGEKRLVAFLVAPGAVDVGRVRARLRRELPDYLVPSVYYRVEELPLSPNGKVDRAALVATMGTRPRLGGTDDTAPRDEIERLLTDVWGALLGVDRVGVDDDFFELGGHSLLAVRVISRVNEVFDVNLPLRTLMTNPNPRALAGEIRRARADRRDSADPPLPLARRPEQVPLTFAQQRLWFMDQLNPGTSLYNVPLVLRLRGRLDVTALRGALRDLVERHEALRTRFPAPGGRPEQVVEPPVEPPVPVVDLTDRADAPDVAAKLAAEEASLPFDLATGPLLRVRLIHLRADEHWLLLTVHHIVADGAGLDVALRDLSVLYRARLRGEPAELPPPALQIADYAVWQRAQVDGGHLDTLLDYWRETIGVDPPELVLPTDRPAPRRRSFRGAVARHALAPELADRIRELSRAAGATPFMTLLAGFQALLASWSGARDVTIGVPVAARSRPELADLVGCVLNLVPVRLDLTGVADFTALLARVRRACLGAFAHQELPFDKLVEALVRRRRRDLMPIFRVMFALIEERPALTFEGIDRCELEIGWPQDSSRFDLALEAVERDGAYTLMLQYDTDLYDESTARWLLTEYQRVLTRAVTAPDADVLTSLDADVLT